jgi:cholesterol transport system auxiliary component
MKTTAIPPAVLCAVVLLAAGCSIRQPAVVTEYFTFDPPSATRVAPGDKSITVLPLTASPTASGQMFLYRSGEARYEHDFYNRFLAPPGQLLTDDLRRYLHQAKAGPVREPGAPLSSDYLVQPRLDDLYADYRDTSRPRAVVAMTIVLVAREPGGNRQVFERTYRHAIPMSDVSPAAAVRGWSHGTGQIFRQFTRDLRGAGS